MNATWFLQHGCGVFPLIKGEKRPSGPWRGLTRPRDVSGLRHYGVEPMPPLVVLDVDTVETAEWVEQAIARGEFPESPFRVLTGPYHDGSGGRGMHRYYRFFGSPAPRTVLRDTISMEFRSEGQYVVGPGSTHPSGVIYEPTDWSWVFDDLPVFPADFVFDDGSCGQRTSAVRGEEYMPPARVTRGERRAELFRLVRSNKGLGMDKEVARHAVNIFANEVCDPPLTAKDFAPETPDKWFNRVWNLADRPIDRLGVRVPINIDLSTPEWF
jgi:hypothetical protein